MKLGSENLNITLRHLRALHAIRAQGSFARAAEALGVVPSALTETVRQAEEEVGAPLFDRRMRPPQPTPLGLAFLEETAPVLAGLDRALGRMRAQAGLSAGRLAVGAAPSAIGDLVGPALARFRAAHPGISCLLHDDVAERLAGLVSDGTLDLAVAGRARQSPDLTQTELRRDPFGLACGAGHRLAARGAVTLSEIDPAEVITLSAETGTRQLLAGAAALPEALKETGLQAHSTIAQLCMIRAGLGVALMPKAAVGLFGDPAIRFVPVTDLGLWRALYLLEPARRARSHVAAAFLEELGAR
ncbi:LysR family transcriptional regulator [Rhodovulum kholense]|uniref:DNA-binding transcriptional LysR family regulator n=1 Tax=Rhodovulum kholense TaxID=453584 RepID=A0A8E3APV4_9RHOB|nr:LysR family transcriptional regulator [Rhodovulum kholense]PTW46618.1 DNA-binding transcriptional LysR family regulator [Rhodovulum kholense]